MDNFSDTIKPRFTECGPIREDVDRTPVRQSIRFKEPPTAHGQGRRFTMVRRDIQYLSQAFRTSMPLWLSDLCVLVGSLQVAGWIGTVIDSGFDVNLFGFAIPLIIALTVVNLTAGLYPGIGLSPAHELRLTTIASTLIFSIFVIATQVAATNQADSLLMLLLAYASCLIGLPLVRTIARKLACNFDWWKQPALLFGGDEAGAKAYRALLEHPQLGLQPIGIIDDLSQHWVDTTCDSDWYLGQFHDAALIAEQRRVFWGIVALPYQATDDFTVLIDRISTTVPNLVIIPSFEAAGRCWDGAHDCGGSFGARYTEMLLLPVPRFIKRSLDILLGTILAVVLAPAMLGIAIAIKLTSSGRIIYRQTVLGSAGRQFSMWKFRTMHVNGHHILSQWLETNPQLKEEWDRHHKLRNDPRVTRVGKFLRQTSLDELPQILNVLKGDMSLVGPRPYPLYECEEMQTKAPVVLRLRPGITGLWQVSGRSNMTFEQRLAIDTKYVRNWSLWVDLAILAKTIVVVLRKKGAY